MKCYVFVMIDFLYTTRIRLRSYALISLPGDAYRFHVTWYDRASWQCSRHLKGRLSTVVDSAKSALHGSSGQHRLGVVLMGHAKATGRSRLRKGAGEIQ